MIVNDWLGKNFIQEVDKSEVTVINPLTFVTKMGDHGRKDRVCLDLSRAVNPLMVPHGAKLDNLPIVLDNLQQNEFMTSIDLSEMYCSVAMHPDFRKYLGKGLYSFIVNLLVFASNFKLNKNLASHYVDARSAPNRVLRFYLSI